MSEPQIFSKITQQTERTKLCTKKILQKKSQLTLTDDLIAKGSGIFLEGLRTMVSMHFNGIMLKKPISSS
jgi:hypothetical protein